MRSLPRLYEDFFVTYAQAKKCDLEVSHCVTDQILDLFLRNGACTPVKMASFWYIVAKVFLLLTCSGIQGAYSLLPSNKYFESWS